MENDLFFSNRYSENKCCIHEEEPVLDDPGYANISLEPIERGIDLNEQLVRNKEATSFMRVNSSSMINAGIFEGDIVVVDSSIKPTSGKIVIAMIDQAILIRRLDLAMNKLRLVPETPGLSTIEVSGLSDFKICGVVAYVIRKTV